MAADNAAGSDFPSNSGNTGSSEDPPMGPTSLEQPPPETSTEWGVYGNEDSDCDSVDSYEMITNPDLPAREKEL